MAFDFTVAKDLDPVALAAKELQYHAGLVQGFAAVGGYVMASHFLRVVRDEIGALRQKPTNELDLDAVHVAALHNLQRAYAMRLPDNLQFLVAGQEGAYADRVRAAAELLLAHAAEHLTDAQLRPVRVQVLEAARQLQPPSGPEGELFLEARLDERFPL